MHDIHKEDGTENVYANLENRTQDNVYETLNLKRNSFRRGVNRENKHVTLWRAGAICLGLLCVVLLAAISGLYAQYLHIQKSNYELQQTLSEHQVNFTMHMHDKMAQYNSIVTSQGEMQKSYNTLIKEKERLVINNQAMTAHINQLELDKQTLTIKVSEKERQVIELGGTCPDGWQRFKCSCYYASTEVKNWSASRQYCQTRGGDLVVIKTREEQEFLKTLNKTFSTFWIGLSDMEQEGVWTWVDGTALLQGYWTRGEPNDVGQDEDCAVSVSHYTVQYIWLHGKQLQAWNDISCAANSYWICERKPQ